MLGINAGRRFRVVPLGGNRGNVRGYAAFLLPQTLARFRASYPNIEVTVRCALSAQLAEEISKRQIDIALATRMPNVHPKVRSVTLLRCEPLVWLAARKCRVLDMSNLGAKIKVDDPQLIGPIFDLKFERTDQGRLCKVQWQKGSIIGVEFV